MVWTISLRLGHEFPSKAFACFSAGHQKTLLWRPEGYFPSGKTHLPPPAMRNSEADNLNKEPERGKVVRSKPFLLKSHSYLKYKAYSDLFQPTNHQPFFAGSSGLGLGGLPILIFLIISSVSGGYIAWRVMGLMPALCIRASTVLKGKFKASHISLIVKPSISSISVIYRKYLIIARIFLHYTKQVLSKNKKYFEKSARIFLYFIDKVKEYSYI
jgi:hypothetical protein